MPIALLPYSVYTYLQFSMPLSLYRPSRALTSIYQTLAAWFPLQHALKRLQLPPVSTSATSTSKNSTCHCRRLISENTTEERNVRHSASGTSSSVLLIRPKQYLMYREGPFNALSDTYRKSQATPVF